MRRVRSDRSRNGRERGPDSIDSSPRFIPRPDAGQAQIALALSAEGGTGHGHRRLFAQDRSIQSLPANMSCVADDAGDRSEEHTSELQSLMRISYAVFCLKKKLHSLFLYSFIFHYF